MLMLPYLFCEDDTANKLITQNVNKIIARMMEFQMDRTINYKDILSYSDLETNKAACYAQIGRFFPRWVSPEDAVTQYILAYLLVRSRRYYKPYILHQYLLAALIKESVYLATEVLADGDRLFRCPFRAQDRVTVGNAMAEEFIQTVNTVYGAYRLKEGVDKYTLYSRIPYPERKVADFESIYKLEELCLDDGTYTLLGDHSPAQMSTFIPDASIIEPMFTPPDAWWTLAQDICDVPGNPPGAATTDADTYLMYMDAD